MDLLWPIKWLIEFILVTFHNLFVMVGLGNETVISWVLSIVAMVLVVRAALIPIFVRQIKSQRNMMLAQPELLKLQKKYKGKTDRESRERMAREQPALHQLYAGLSALTDPAIRERARHEITALRNRSPEILAGLTMPVLYLEGEEDLVFPPLAGPALAKATPDGSCRSVPAAGHSVYFERAAEFNAIVDEFVAKRVFSDRTQRT